MEGWGLGFSNGVGVYNILIDWKICPERPSIFRKRRKRKNPTLRPRKRRRRSNPTIGISFPTGSRTGSTSLSPSTPRSPTSSPQSRAAIRASRLLRGRNAWLARLRRQQLLFLGMS